MDAKTQNVIADLVELWQRRDDNLEQTIVAWSGSNLSPVQANDLIAIIRNSQSAIDVKNELALLTAALINRPPPETKEL